MNKRLSLLSDEEAFKLLEDDTNFDYDTDGEAFSDGEIDDFNELIEDQFRSCIDEVVPNANAPSTSSAPQATSTEPVNPINTSSDTAGFSK